MFEFANRYKITLNKNQIKRGSKAPFQFKWKVKI